MGKAGRLKIKRDYNSETLNDQLEKSYQNVLRDAPLEQAGIYQHVGTY